MAQWHKTGPNTWDDGAGHIQHRPIVQRDLPVGDTFEDPEHPGKFRRIVDRQITPEGAIVVIHVDA